MFLLPWFSLSLSLRVFELRRLTDVVDWPAFGFEACRGANAMRYPPEIAKNTTDTMYRSFFNRRTKVSMLPPRLQSTGDWERVRAWPGRQREQCRAVHLWFSGVVSVHCLVLLPPPTAQAYTLAAERAADGRLAGSHPLQLLQHLPERRPRTPAGPHLRSSFHS